MLNCWLKYKIYVQIGIHIDDIKIIVKKNTMVTENIKSLAHLVKALQENWKAGTNPTGCLVGLRDPASLWSSH